MRLKITTAAGLLLVSSCGSPPSRGEQNAAEVSNNPAQVALPDSSAPPTNQPAQPAPEPATPAEPAGAAPGTPGGLPDDRTPLEEPRGAIDPKSAEGAGQIVQLYGGLLEQRRFAEARKSWGDAGKASGLTEAEFAAAYDKYATIHSEVGKPTDMEGAAGSSYITVPFHLFGTLKSGGAFNLVGPLTLRRVNDVPGSTQAQRRWHIEQSGLKARP